MDIFDLDTKGPQEDGAFMHMTHTKYGFPLYTGPNADKHGRWINADEEPDEKFAVGFMIRGNESKTVQDCIRKQKRVTAANARKSVPIPDDELFEEAGVKFACALILSFVNLERDGEPLEATEENKRWFIGLSDDIGKQVTRFAKVADNFFENLLSN